MTPHLVSTASLVTPGRPIRPLAGEGIGAYRGWWWFYGFHGEEAVRA